MHVTNKQFSDKFNNGLIFFSMAYLEIVIFRIWPCGLVNFKFNNGTRLLSSALLLICFYLPIKSLLLGMKWVFKHQDSQIIQIIMTNYE